MSNITLYETIETSANPLATIERMGVLFAGSGMFKCRSSEQGAALAMICLTSQMTPMEFLQKYHLYPDGTISKRSRLILAEFRERGGKFRWLRTGEEDDQEPENLKAVLELEYEGNKITVSMDMARATAAGWVKKDSAWVKQPGEMLRARCITKGVGIVCPEIFVDTSDLEAQQQQPEPKTLFENAKSEHQRNAQPSPNPTTETADDAGPHDAAIDAEVIEDTPGGPSNVGAPNDPVDDRGPEPAPRGQDDGEPEAEAYSGKLPEATYGELMIAIAGEERRALIYIKTLGWIKPDQGFGDLDWNKARAIIDRTEAFLKAVKEKVA